MTYEFSPQSQEMRRQIATFVDFFVYPNEETYRREREDGPDPVFPRNDVLRRDVSYGNGLLPTLVTIFEHRINVACSAWRSQMRRAIASAGQARERTAHRLPRAGRLGRAPVEIGSEARPRRTKWSR
ncbi:MAG: hypothetical protein NVS3B12_13710 [Acidimicrobiales bacterium]